MRRFSLRTLLALAALLAGPGALAAQQADAAADTVFRRAQRLAAQGSSPAARTLVDSVLAAAVPGSPRYAEALFWRASFAATAADAERDYRRLAVEFPLSPRSEDALVRLAQLELARGDRALALRHLERLSLEHPSSPNRARTSYWRARIFLEDNNLPRACAALADAMRHAPAGDVELRNQLDYHTQRCLGVDTTAVAAATAPVTTPASPAPAASAPAPTSPARADTAPRTAPATPRAAPATARTQYTVQVAAFPSRAQADALRARLVQRGYEARTVGAGQLFRVRIGRFDTRGGALELAAELKANKISPDAFVAEAEAR